MMPPPSLRLIKELSHGSAPTDNWLIHGNNSLVLPALAPALTGRVKCAYLDPPYNTGQAFQQYSDRATWSGWSEDLRGSLSQVKGLLHPTDGSIWVSIDDRAVHYLRLLLDEVFGPSNFIATIIWQKRGPRENRSAIGDAHEYVVVYAMNPRQFTRVRNCLPMTPLQQAPYRNPDNDPRGPWRATPLLAQGAQPNQRYGIRDLFGDLHYPLEGCCWKLTEPSYQKLLAEDRVYFGSSGNGEPCRKLFLKDSKGIVPWTWWPHAEVGHTAEAKNEQYKLFGRGAAFDTPKPERLLHRILTIATNPGDLVLDPYLGSGTTAAVAHKMGRTYVGIENGPQARALCAKRLQMVAEGLDPGGVTPVCEWQGGGFQFYEHSPEDSEACNT